MIFQKSYADLRDNRFDKFSDISWRLWCYHDLGRVLRSMILQRFWGDLRDHWSNQSVSWGFFITGTTTVFNRSLRAQSLLRSCANLRELPFYQDTALFLKITDVTRFWEKTLRSFTLRRSREIFSITDLIMKWDGCVGSLIFPISCICVRNHGSHTYLKWNC